MAIEAAKGLEGFSFRPFCEADIPFIYSSWGQSFLSGKSAHMILSPAEFHEFHRPIIERFFSRPTATVLVCQWDQEPNTIIAWAAVEMLHKTLVLHYIYVKAAFKREGIATEMLERIGFFNRPTICTHLTDKAKKILSNHSDKFKKLTYIPHIV